MRTIEYSMRIAEEIGNTLSTLNNDDIEILLKDIRKARRIFFLAAGRSRIMLSAFCMRLNHLGFSAYMVGEVTTPPAGKEDLLIVTTGSGKTLSVLSIMNKAKSIGTRIDLFTAETMSPAAKIADYSIAINTPSKLVNDSKELQLMRTLFEQCVFILTEAIVIELSEGMNRNDIASRHANLE